ncbi:hypothetical protein KP509_12G041000 [Ceratopteris richardii]|uniref:Calmodulin-binding protein n=1 Tax=Ceratopteris richardii TaxID=49495 RepID=A0A8T2TNX2_CERRI|nr:hypothetical protein KP509_12G041000 [Ceratopteris richardii]
MHYMTRFGSDQGDSSGSNGGPKRSFDKVRDDNEGSAMGEKRQKLPALSSVVLEAVKMDSLQKLCSSLEPLLRRVVGEEVERALARLVPNNRLGTRTPRQLQDSPPNLKLEFSNKLCLPLFTGGKVEGDQCLPVLVLLKDASTGQVINSRPESSAKLEVVVLDGDFANEDDEWTAEDFENNVVKEREGKRPLLTGDLTITLKEGVGTLGDLTFTDNSSWIRSRKFRLGVRVAPGFPVGVRIKECKTEAFTVKDHRGELYKKHYPPQLNDEVWRLDKIGKDGAFHKRLQDNNIRTVEDFLRCYVRDPQKLRTILGNGMSSKMWDATVEHAKTCVLKGKLYVHYTDDSHSVGVIFNDIYELMGVTNNNVYRPLDSLNESEKTYVDKLVKNAYADWSKVVEYDDVTSINGSNDKNSLQSSENGNPMEPQEQPIIYEPMDVSQPTVQYPTLPTSTNITGSITPQLYGYGGQELPYPRYTHQGTQMIQGTDVFGSVNDPEIEPSTNITFQNNFPSTIGPSCTGYFASSNSGLVFRSQPVPAKSFTNYITPQMIQGVSADWQRYLAHNPTTPDVYLTEDLIRAQAVDMLNHDEMQNLLRTQSIMRVENFSLQNEYSGFDSASSTPTSVDGGRSSGKAYVGWLKVKAALRWGIFIRKIAAKKIQRAQLEEIN